MSKLDELLEEMVEDNVEYLSDVSMKWFYSRLIEMKASDKTSIKNEIKNEVEVVLPRKGRFYYFDYMPINRKNDIYESFDRKPLVLFLEKRDKTLYGLNINYLRIDKRSLFLNKCFRYLVGDMKNENPYLNRLALNYRIMELKNNFVEHKVIFRKYLIGRIKNLRLIPLNRIKIFASLENTSMFPMGIDKIHNKVNILLKEEARKRTKKSKKKM